MPAAEARVNDKPAYVTPERVEEFARYLSEYSAWGYFHVWLDDGNYKIKCNPDDPKYPVHGSTRDMRHYFALLSPSQRKKLGDKAEAMEREWRKNARVV
jgi:hypothetical protein